MKGNSCIKWPTMAQKKARDERKAMDKTIYCPACQCEFRGLDKEAKYRSHYKERH